MIEIIDILITEKKFDEALNELIFKKIQIFYIQ